MAKKKFYAVKKGHKTGVFMTWPECQASVKGYKGSVFKGFETKDEAIAWLDEGKNKLIRSEKGSNESLNIAREVDFDVYTDGSYFEGRYSYGYAFIKNDKVVYEGYGVGEDSEAARMRNVAGEIAAVRHAVERAKSLNVSIRIFHDYSGISHWVTGDWQAKNKFTQEYAAFMKAHHGLYEFQKVTGHSGDKFNDYVDQLAKKALGIGSND